MKLDGITNVILHVIVYCIIRTANKPTITYILEYRYTHIFLKKTIDRIVYLQWRLEQKLRIISTAFTGKIAHRKNMSIYNAVLGVVDELIFIVLRPEARKVEDNFR